MKVTTIVVVPHVHWDREWYFTSEESQLLAAKDFAEILDHLESHPEYPSFVMDGQTSILEEYLKTKPEDAPRVQALVREGRLHVGPFYTQTDEMVVGGEAIVRNLLYGTEAARGLGATMEIGYVPDSFGQSSRMPSILNQFGIGRSVFWRGQSQFCGTDACQFWWRAEDGSRVLVNQLLLGYATGKYLPEDPEALQKRLGRLIALWDELSPTPYAILPNGHDQMPIQKNIDTVIEGLKKAFPGRDFVLGSLDDALDLVEAYDREHPLPEVSGEFLHGKRERVHRSIYSVRMDNKIAAAQAEHALVHEVEPLLALASQLGIDVPRELEREPWRMLLESQAHDSIGGCCSDKVNGEIAARLARVNERAELLRSYVEREIVEAALPAHTSKLGLFNMLPASDPRLVDAEVVSRTGAFRLQDASGADVAYETLSTETIPAGLVDRQLEAAGLYEPFVRSRIRLRRALPPLGYEVLEVHEDVADPVPAPEASMRDEFETDCYRIGLRSDGALDIVCKADGVRYEGALALEIEANDGDEYDFSPLPEGRTILASDLASCTPACRETASSFLVDISYAIPMPAYREAWLEDEPETVPLGVHIALDIDKTSPLIDIVATLDCQADDYRIRMRFPAGAEIRTTYADNQFGLIERGVTDPALEVWEQEGWSERPDPIYPFVSQVSASDGGRAVAAFTQSAREFEMAGAGHDILDVTLLSGVGMLGRSDLVRRPGRPSGIMVPAADAQCHGVFELHLGCAFGQPVSDPVEVSALAERWLGRPTSFHRFDYVPINLSLPERELPASFGLAEQKNPHLIFSAAKRPEAGEGIVLRFVNGTDEPQVPELEGMEIVSCLGLDEADRDGEPVAAPRSMVTVRARMPKDAR